LAEPIETKRRLVAIFAADVEGYSRLMGADEVATLDTLTARREILDGLLATHGGRIANTAGDSVLAEFGSAVDAVRCAMEAQIALAKANSILPENRQINFRIGVHVGDVMVRAGDLFGDGVNIAARLQTLARAGGLCVSGVTYDQVRKILPLSFTDLGAQAVKNIEEPVRAYQVEVRGMKAPSAAKDGLPPVDSKPPILPDKPSIAVLPFQNMSGDPEQEYFSDGMVEDITTALSRFKSLFVIARNSSFTYKGKAIDIKQVGHELGVRYVLEGSVRKSGGRVRITCQLIEASTGAHLWADKFDGALEEVFDLQDGITEQIVTILVPRVRKAEIERLERKRPDSLDAYDSILRAQALMRNENPKDIPATLVHLERAIQLVPNYALAHAFTASCYARIYIAGANIDLEEDRRKARYFARRAVELDNDDPEVLAHASLALGNYGEGETALFLAERSISLNPNLASGWFMVGSINLYAGDYEKALECQARSLRLTPIGPGRSGVMASTSLAYLLSNRHEEAYSWAERAYQENPNHPFALRALAMCAALVGKRARAHMAFQHFAPAYSRFLERTKIFMAGNKDFEKIVEAMRLASTPE
jgi:adenylate cyclase